MNKFVELMAFSLYFTLWSLGLIILKLFIKFMGRDRVPYKIKNFLLEREYPQLIWKCDPSPTQRRVWFHASSGEIEYIKPLLKLWKKKYPEDLIFLTYFSTSARSMIKNVSEIDGFAALPFDMPGKMNSFCRQLKPNLVVISRTDLWPYMLFSLKDTPKILVASTWSEGNKKTRGLGKLMSRWCLSYLNKVCVVSRHDEEWIKRHSPKTLTQVAGDPRFDQVKTRLLESRILPPALEHWKSKHFLFIAGSTWPEDEKVILNSIQSLLNKDHYRYLIVPHEVTSDSIQQLKEELRQRQIPFQVWSEEIKKVDFTLDAPVVLFDQKGWLADLYRIGDVCFIGGSFKKQVHSVMEALGCGLPVMVGPYYKNNREAIEFSQLYYNSIAYVNVVNNEQAIINIFNLLNSFDLNTKIDLKMKILKAFEDRCGGSIKTFSEIESLLLTNS